MICVEVSRNQNKKIIAAEVKGHAGFADAGSDIVCAAVSILIQNAVNSIEALCGISLKAKSRNGFVSFTSHAYADHRDVQLLLESMVIGMRGIHEAYSDYVGYREYTV